MLKTKTLNYQHYIDHPIELVWQAISDTERLNLISGAGFSPYVGEDVQRPDGTLVRKAAKKIGPFVWRWQEDHGQWIEHDFIRHARHFDNGPFREMTATFSLKSQGQGTLLHCDFFGSWDSLLGQCLASIGMLTVMTRPIPKIMAQMVEDHAERERRSSALLDKDKTQLKSAAMTRLDDALAAIDKSAYGHGLTQQLKDYLSRTDVIALKRIRPLEVAKRWGVSQDQVIELFIAAHKQGLLALRWEVMCPRCRGGKAKSTLLSDVPNEVHCDSCRIDYGRDFISNVELVFSPATWLRDLPEGDFCLMSAKSTPHVKLQCLVAPGETRSEAADLEDGRYRVRTVEPGAEREIDIAGSIPAIALLDDGIQIGDPLPKGQVQLENRGTVPRTLVIESTSWLQHALNGPKVISLQAFRELCPEQLLRPGDDVEIDRVAVLFSDLTGSTALYEDIGDSRAYALVRAHFAYLETRVHRHGGIIVKTIGDSIMAAFRSGDQALAAALDIQREVSAFNEAAEQGSINLKIGMHEGPCIAVTIMGSIDYFGGTVNLAARLQSQAQGGEIVFSRAFDGYPIANEIKNNRLLNEDRAILPGFEKPTDFYRLKAN